MTDSEAAYLMELETELSEAYILGDKKRAAHLEEMIAEFNEYSED